MQKRLLFKIGYFCKIPWGGGRGAGGMTIWPTVYKRLRSEEDYDLVESYALALLKKVQIPLGENAW